MRQEAYRTLCAGNFPQPSIRHHLACSEGDGQAVATACRGFRVGASDSTAGSGCQGRVRDAAASPRVRRPSLTVSSRTRVDFSSAKRAAHLDTAVEIMDILGKVDLLSDSGIGSILSLSKSALVHAAEDARVRDGVFVDTVMTSYELLDYAPSDGSDSDSDNSQWRPGKRTHSRALECWLPGKGGKRRRAKKQVDGDETESDCAQTPAKKQDSFSTPERKVSTNPFDPSCHEHGHYPREELDGKTIWQIVAQGCQSGITSPSELVQYIKDYSRDGTSLLMTREKIAKWKSRQKKKSQPRDRSRK